MKTSAIIRIVVWGFVAVIILAVLIAGFTGSLLRNVTWNFPGFGFMNNSMYSAQYEHDDRYMAGNGSVSAAEITNIEIEWIEGAVTVIPTDTDVITFSETSRYELEERYKLHYYVNNGKLSIQYCASRLPLNIRRLYGKALTVTIPRELYLEAIQVQAVSAKVEVDAVSAESIDIEAVSGALSLTNLTARTIKVEAISGHMTLEGLTADSLQVSGVSGGTRIERSKLANVSCELVSGSIYIEPGADVRDVNAETVSGSIRLVLPEHSGFTARFSEVSGNFRCDFPVEMKGKHMAVYNGGGAEFQFTSISGAIHIEQG